MLDLQNEINTKIDPTWETRGQPWYRAIWIEAGEMMDHIGYKWWKHQSIDIAQVQLEVVDIWHFALSIYCEKGISAHQLVPIFKSNLLDAPEITCQEIMSDTCEDFVISVLNASTLQASFPLEEFINLMSVTGMNMDTLYRQYVGKNVLNAFRQDHGYKDGTYIKDWHGEEDNVVLSRLAAGLGIAGSEFPTMLRDALEMAYAYAHVIAEQPSL